MESVELILLQKGRERRERTGREGRDGREGRERRELLRRQAEEAIDESRVTQGMPRK